jgi:hypothetical protein
VALIGQTPMSPRQERYPSTVFQAGYAGSIPVTRSTTSRSDAPPGRRPPGPPGHSSTCEGTTSDVHGHPLPGSTHTTYSAATVATSPGICDEHLSLLATAVSHHRREGPAKVVDDPILVPAALGDTDEDVYVERAVVLVEVDLGGGRR